jgi:large subunit ribosomal protein L37Ae
LDYPFWFGTRRPQFERQPIHIAEGVPKEVWAAPLLIRTKRDYNMAGAKHSGSVKRLGARYGRKTRARVAAIEALSRSLHKCPSCSTMNVKRLSLGIWQCRKCNHKFTSRAYTVARVPSLKEAEVQMGEPAGETAEGTGQEEVAQ